MFKRVGISSVFVPSHPLSFFRCYPCLIRSNTRFPVTYRRLEFFLHLQLSASWTQVPAFYTPQAAHSMFEALMPENDLLASMDMHVPQWQQEHCSPLPSSCPFSRNLSQSAAVYTIPVLSLKTPAHAGSSVICCMRRSPFSALRDSLTFPS